MFQSLKLIKNKAFEWIICLNRMQEYTINVHYIMYMNRPKKNLKGNFVKCQGGLFKLSPLRSEDSQDSGTGGWTS